MNMSTKIWKIIYSHLMFNIKYFKPNLSKLDCVGDGEFAPQAVYNLLRLVLTFLVILRET